MDDLLPSGQVGPLLVVGWLAGWLLLWRLPVLRRPVEPRDEPAGTDTGRTVSVVVPARNEADRLPGLLASLAAQERPAAEVIVVDDGSDDDTAAVAAASPGVRLVAARPLPAGWTGKSWACATGAEAATGDLLVFLDADVVLAPEALAAVEDEWATSGGLVSVQPRHDAGRPVESLSLPFNVITVMGLGIGSLVPPRRQWGAAGPCMVLAAEVYAEAGGHRAVRSAVAEDLALAARCRAAGHPVRCLGGGSSVRYRMYRGLRGLLEGWSKNLAVGAGSTPRLRALVVAAWVTAVLAGIGVLVGTDAGLGDRAAVYVAGAVQFAWHGTRVGRFGPAALLWPLLALVFVAVFTWSLLRTLVFRSVRWSGRTLRVGASTGSTG